MTTLTERINAYLDACPAAISGQHGHDRTFAVAIALVRGFDLSPERALSFLQRYNERCQPKWTTEELKHKLRDADQVGTGPGRPLKPRGYLL
jgi:putative DNA primase/helicase